ncbi:family 43 glycosylhydrolase [Oscillospiraceae bacterium HV4-5-C5C]|nr:family 43 glycosylhydrolase [Oscillospiraceae bacterium HV4-5-C5C]
MMTSEIDYPQLLCYTRYPLADELYASRLAYSLHLGWLNEQGLVEPLNHDYGVLFASAYQLENGQLQARSLRSVWLFEIPGGYALTALLCHPDGAPDDSELSRGRALLYTTKDLVHYQRQPDLLLQGGQYIRDLRVRYHPEQKVCELYWFNMDSRYFTSRLYGGVTGEPARLTAAEPTKGFPDWAACALTRRTDISARSALNLPDPVRRYLKAKLEVPVNTANTVVPEVCAAGPADLDQVKARAIYSDQTDCLKPVDWDLSGVRWEKPGRYQINGRVRQPHFSFPFAQWRADPCLTYWKGQYYFIATNDADQNHSFSIRRAALLTGLAEATEYEILNIHQYPFLKDLLWAPEFHVINGQLMLFHGGTPEGFAQEQCWVTRLRRGGDPCVRGDWLEPQVIRRANGDSLFKSQAGTSGITLDLTVFETQATWYAVWSQRQFLPVDTGAWLYIAQIDPERPWQLCSEPVLLTLPEYAWENNHAFVVEGPYMLKRHDQLCLVYSGALIDSSYTVGMLTASPDADLLNPACWRKNNYPLLSSLSVPGEYGPGHNAFMTDQDGLIWNSYHAHAGLEAPRSSGIRRVHLDIDGQPRLDLTEERDLKPELAEVRTWLTVI